MLRSLLAAVLIAALGCGGEPAAPEHALAGGDAGEPMLADAAADAAALDRDIAEAHTELSGGATTVFDVSAEAFEHPSPNLSGDELARHEEGDEQFERVFVPSPDTSNPGLGPVFDNVSCEACHEGDGRGRPPTAGGAFESMLFRISGRGVGPRGSPAPVPGFGTQAQLRAVPGLQPEARASISYLERSGTFADGTSYTLEAPTYTLTGVYEPLPSYVRVSPRVANMVFGLGLLEAVPEADILRRAEPVDINRDGVSGHANFVYDAIAKRFALGRFGWKANQPNLDQQAAGAYNGDMGITSTLFPSESCEEDRPECAPHEPPEIGDEAVASTALYTRTLGVPARRDLEDPRTLRGERLFHTSGCATCHVATLRTGVVPGVPSVSNQVIHPYTDLLVHDMGPDLADNRPDFGANGREWRTAPLWGIGLIKTVNGHTSFMHDGRARSLLEAVLWHGGEAEAAREKVKALPAEDRAALVAFLESL